MPTSPEELIALAFERLRQQPGFMERAGQIQLSSLLSDLIAGGQSGAFEAPTGLGKSLACLIPAFAHAIAGDKRTVIATYTNVLADQYWQKDVPFAASLFDEEVPTALLLGRQRYACLVDMDQHLPQQMDAIRARLTEGTETEFRRTAPISKAEISKAWSRIAVPPVCPARACPVYHDCYFYSARRRAEKAKVIITNHNVVIQNALMASGTEGGEGEGILGKLDFIVLDEAHDFASAAQNGLEFELSAPRIRALLGLLGRLEGLLRPALERGSFLVSGNWDRFLAEIRKELDVYIRQFEQPGAGLGTPGILQTAPSELEDNPAVKQFRAAADLDQARALVMEVASVAQRIVDQAEGVLDESDRGLKETARNYISYFSDFARGCEAIFTPHGVSVSYLGQPSFGFGPQDAILRQDIVDLGPPLTEMLWSKVPHACISATLVLDGEFTFFERSIGLKPDFREILESPFDHSTQAAVYIPKVGSIPDPSAARRDGNEANYYRALASELQDIIEACQGRTLALFHSRKEMEGVFQLMNREEFPILMQPKTGAAAVGDRFKESPEISLFALRSFWTGFDAPGDTLSCVVLVRVPFEVPTEPIQIARMAYLVSQGIDPFREHTLAQTKMMVRQGAGRLIRRSSDKGVIALLDPRLKTKRYGEEILANLPSDMRVFDDIADAVGWIGLDEPHG